MVVRVGVRRSLLHVAQRDTGVETGSDERVPQGVRADLLGGLCTAGDPADDRGVAVPVQPLSVCGDEQRPSNALADGQVEGAGGARGERAGDDLAALAGDGESPVTALQAQVLDVRAGRFGHAQPVEPEQGDQRALGRRSEAGGDQERPSSLRSSAVACDS
jgi:hypothetical protein